MRTRHNFVQKYILNHMGKKKKEPELQEEEVLESQEPTEVQTDENSSVFVEEEPDEAPATKRSKFIDRMRSRKPDVDYDDEEGRYGAFLDYDDEREGRIGRLEESDMRMRDMLKRDPKFAQMMLDVSNGDEAPIAFARHFGEFMGLDLQDPEVAEQVAAENKQRIERIAKEEEENKRFEETREKNLSTSGEVISKFLEEKGIDDGKAKEMLDLYVQIANEGISGEVTEETLNILFHGMSYDEDLRKARENGLTEGRNERIDRNTIKKMGDGIPHLTSIGNSTPLATKELGGLNYRGRKSMYDMK